MAEFSLCLNTSTIRPAPLLRKVEVAAQAGFDGIEPWNDEIDEYVANGGSLRELRQSISDAGLSVPSLIALGGWAVTGEDAYRAAREECRRRMEQAVSLGCPLIVASPPAEVVDLAFASRRYADLLRLGREIGVRPAMEFLGFVAGIDTTAAAWAVACGTGDPEAGIVSDVFHMMRARRCIDDLLSLPGDRLLHFHINDVPANPPAAEQTDHDRVMPGQGMVDLPQVIKHLRAIGYRGWLSLELFNRELWQRDPLEVAREGRERLERLIAVGTASQYFASSAAASSA